MNKYYRLFHSFCQNKKFLPIRVTYNDFLVEKNVPQNSLLSQQLEFMKIPLPFECEYSAQCGTCAIQFSKQDFEKIADEQPIGPSQEATIRKNSLQKYHRLSCRLKVTKTLSQIAIKIEKND